MKSKKNIIRVILIILCVVLMILAIYFLLGGFGKSNMAKEYTFNTVDLDDYVTKVSSEEYVPENVTETESIEENTESEESVTESVSSEEVNTEAETE